MKIGSVLLTVPFIMFARHVEVTRYSFTQWISKFPVSFGKQRERQYLVNVVLFGIKDLETSEMIIKLKSNMYIRPAIILPNFDDG